MVEKRIYFMSEPQPLQTNICTICGQQFIVINSGYRTCSTECSKKLAAQSHTAPNGYVKHIKATFDRYNSPPPLSGHNNIIDALISVGHDEDFEPQVDTPFKKMNWRATEAGPGSQAKIEVLARRVELGLPLWHEDDECVCSRVNNVMKDAKGVSVPSVKMYAVRRKKLGE